MGILINFEKNEKIPILLKLASGQFFVFQQGASNSNGVDGDCKDKIPMCINFMCGVMGEVCPDTCGRCKNNNDSSDSFFDYFEGFDSVQIIGGSPGSFTSHLYEDNYRVGYEDTRSRF